MGWRYVKLVASISQEGGNASITKSIIHADKEENDVHDPKIFGILIYAKSENINNHLIICKQEKRNTRISKRFSDSILLLPEKYFKHFIKKIFKLTAGK